MQTRNGDLSQQNGAESNSSSNHWQSQIAAVTRKLGSLPVQELKLRLPDWRNSLSTSENRLCDLLLAIQCSNSAADIHPKLTQARQEYEKFKFLCQTAQRVLTQNLTHYDLVSIAKISTTVSQPNTHDSAAGRSPALPVALRDRGSFDHFMQMWCIMTKHNVENMPKMGYKLLDLFQLYIQVEELGGLEKVDTEGLWHLVASKMGHVPNSQDATPISHIVKILSGAFVSVLAPFEEFYKERMRRTAAHWNICGPNVTPGTGIVPTEVHCNIANFGVVFGEVNIGLNDWMPEWSPYAKILRLTGMDLDQMQQQGWTDDLIRLITKFKPTIDAWREVLIKFLLEIWQHSQSMTGQHSLQHPCRPTIQFPTSQVPCEVASTIKGAFSIDEMQRAKLVVERLTQDILQTRQYQTCEVPEVQRLQMNYAVVDAHSLAIQFERIASLDYIVFDDQERTKTHLDQIALLKEQHQILQSGQQYYIMSLEEVVTAQQNFRTALGGIKNACVQKVKERQQQVTINFPQPDEFLIRSLLIKKS
ncbi:ARID/BRIGHT DNA binding domain [Ceratobasidium sp. AG-Ba]|nr:ARID/BRIGHT DNA binding domain [Ceratobasidium sp. AG-Ba]